MSTPLCSTYWKIEYVDDKSVNYNIPANTSLSMDNDTIAIGSNYLTENLKIYQYLSNSLIHLASITLPDIQSLKFLKPISQPPHDFKFLITGHSNGIAHLSAVPLNDNSVFENAEIIKRFNHRKQLLSENSTPQNYKTYNNRIQSMELTTSSWHSTPQNSLVSAYDNHLFVWDTSRSRAPISLVRTNGIRSLSLNHRVDSLVAITGEFGLSLVDLRTGKNKDKTSLYLPPSKKISSAPTSPTFSVSNHSNSSLQSPHSYSRYSYTKPKGFKEVQWCETNENYVATSENDTVFIWDIRKLEPFTQLTGLTDDVTQIKWRGDILWTGDQDGFLTTWNLKNLSDIEHKTCTISKNSKLDELWKNFKVNENKYDANDKVCCGSSTKVSNSQILSLELDSSSDRVICLDGSFVSSHEVETAKQYPKVLDKVSNNFTNEFIRKAPPQTDKETTAKRKTSTHSYVSSNDSQIFDTKKDGFHSPISTTFENFSSSNTNLSQYDNTKKNSITGDYLEYFQKEIDELLKSQNVKKVKDTVYL